ncbi:efflux RND transporter periplasmic adaptor subunit [Sphingomonas immobilis]|uniref:Efflux RND transporter periplasmic adaptor subunit n=1 Tax=Sphingomonas immobilis TaxID=3063997 RepID=A0ABT9A0X4_9SPHN|nr:efflux RND transporter periplasmic adaptor subunit [Sphingomonas sp. CA1-15]MDO7843107.1 efflux RND transporter periplasmic adaptor subunit [Sphingomonas sp. CA1-15]
MNYETPHLGNEKVYALPGSSEQPRRWGRIALIAGAVLVVLIAGWMFLRPAPKQAANVQQLPSVTVAIPGRSSVARVVSATGSLAARREMPVGVAGEGGLVTRVLVEPGQWVGAGQVLATVDRSVQQQTAASLSAQISAAKADAGIAQSQYERAQSLVGRGFISKADLEQKAATRDAAVARVRIAQASLAEQQARNGRLDIRAPEAGLVLTRAVEPGQIVSSGSGVLFRMAKAGEMEMRAEVAESELPGISVGTPAQVTPVGSTKSFPGTVWQVSPVVDPTSRRGIARITVAYNKELRPGGFASATITGGTNTAPVLPNSAIQTDASGNFVYVVGSGDKVERRAIKTGEVSDRGVAIVDGITGTEKIVLSAGAFLSPGQKIKPILSKQ